MVVDNRSEKLNGKPNENWRSTPTLNMYGAGLDRTKM